MTYLDELASELGRVGIRGRLRARILAEAADHLAEGDVARFGEPRLIAQCFADELATAQSRRAAFRAFAALALAGAGFAAAWLLMTTAGDGADITSAEFLPLGIASAAGMLVCSQVAFAAGLLSLLRALRIRRDAAAPAASVALLLTRTRVALAFGAATTLSTALFALEYRAHLAGWYVLLVAAGGMLLTLPLAAAAATAARAGALRSAVPGAQGDVFDDLPVRLPRRPWALCLAVALLAGLAAAGPNDVAEGARNAVVEFVLVVGGFAVLGRRLGLRR